MQVDVNLARAAPVKAGGVAGAPEGVWKSGQNLVVDRIQQLINFAAVDRAHAQECAAAEIAQKGIGDFRLFFTADIGQQTLVDGAYKLGLGRVGAHAGGRLQGKIGSEHV